MGGVDSAKARTLVGRARPRRPGATGRVTLPTWPLLPFLPFLLWPCRAPWKSRGEGAAFEVFGTPPSKGSFNSGELSTSPPPPLSKEVGTSRCSPESTASQAGTQGTGQQPRD